MQTQSIAVKFVPSLLIGDQNMNRVAIGQDCLGRSKADQNFETYAIRVHYSPYLILRTFFRPQIEIHHYKSTKKTIEESEKIRHEPYVRSHKMIFRSYSRNGRHVRSDAQIEDKSISKETSLRKRYP
ncbi:hypothetical protein AVEN_235970-1 [Araneus ventricosus]|uniref:Uncharacterized protein n=1 Tax=Araneus ventricosus TaxID=182803 RepID=A0A4Y2KCR3_ARAVE|nr:hypothetical protein AVEN_235970-1 [Araneus ventricosus]